jgi:hypothetical protein
MCPCVELNITKKRELPAHRVSAGVTVACSRRARPCAELRIKGMHGHAEQIHRCVSQSMGSVGMVKVVSNTLRFLK